MAHFARVNEDNVVTEVVVVPDSEEHRGEEFLHELGLEGRWIQTSFTGRIRKAFAVPGALYLEEEDAFQPPKPEANPSFVFDVSEWKWVPPLPMPTDADWVIDFGPQPEPVEREIDGQTVMVADLPPNAMVYRWDEEAVEWARISLEIPTRPEGQNPEGVL